MNRKQNSLMRFSRTERLAQLSEQEIVIERKKREIQAKLEAQKKKETEEALRKFESTKETISNKPGFSKFPLSGASGKKNGNKDKPVDQVKEGLPNAFSNDGSFLDQFKKLSQTGLSHSNVDVQSLAKIRGDSDEIQDINKKQGFFGKEETNEHRSKKDNKSLSDISCSSLSQKPLNSKIQLKIPPPGVVQLVPQPACVKVIASNVNELGLNAPLLSVQKPQHQDTAEHSVSAFNSKNLHSNSTFSNYPDVMQLMSLAHKSDPSSDSKKEEDPAHEMSHNSLSSVQPQLSFIPQNVTPHSPVQVQNIPHPGSKSELPKIRYETISMTLKPNAVKKLEAIPNPLEVDQTPPTSPNKNQCSFTEKEPTFLNASQNFSFTSSLENVSSHDRDSSRISSAFYDNDEDEKEDGYHLNGKYHQWAELVSRYGDEYEDSLRNRCENKPELRFLLDKNSDEYFSYRKLVSMYRKRLKPSEQEPSERLTFPDASKEQSAEKMFCENEEFLKTGDSDKSNCDFKELLASDRIMSVNEHKTHTSPKSFRSRADENVLFNEKLDRTFKEDYFLFNQKQLLSKGENLKEQTVTDNSDQVKTEERRKRKRKSRWGEAVPTTSTSGVEANLQPSGKLPAPKSNLLSQVTRSDPGLIQYARQTFGSTNLSEEDWKKAEDHYKINLLYQDMVKKRAEVEKLEKQGKFKYEYDSDEDTEGGTWEHKLRQQEMQATQLWAEELTRQAAGKHHIGDFLPPEELERFMEKYNAVKEGREPDLSDYKEYKLKQDNVGYRLLQKMGWNEGQGLGQDGSGITNPVNKATTRHENQGLGVERPDGLEAGDDEYDAYRKRMMLAYRFRPNPLNNPRRPYY